MICKLRASSRSNAREDARRAGDELAKQREASARELAAEKARAEASAEEVRVGLQAQLVAAQQLANERASARDHLAQQLEEARAQTANLEVVGRKKPKRTR